MQTIQKVTLIFTIIGALNWGLIGFFNFNLVESLFYFFSSITSIIYSFVGRCALKTIGLLFKNYYSIEK